MAHRDSSIFDQPDKFMPSRFEDEVTKHNCSYLTPSWNYMLKRLDTTFRMFTLRTLQGH